uniref:Putative ibuprofen-CoA dioxygenase small subunit n=1 Tax=uncultured bacterium UPO38 TaxID=1776965 RepID=A0A126SXR4_9BACT|nr:putative ibuprofen-CoA dioxygenase small subunit [uncultured bacterium UPO38]
MKTSEPTAMPAAEAVGGREYDAVRDFLYLEARLADESRYLEWEALVEDDMTYWVPRGEGDFDMNRHVSIIADNRSRLRTRIAQLATGKRHSQVPVSAMRRLIGNIEVERLADGALQALSNFVLYELRRSSTGKLEVWPGRVEHRLRRRPDGSFGMYFKKVMLVHGDEALPSLAFII